MFCYLGCKNRGISKSEKWTVWKLEEFNLIPERSNLPYDDERLCRRRLCGAPLLVAAPTHASFLLLASASQYSPTGASAYAYLIHVFESRSMISPAW